MIYLVVDATYLCHRSFHSTGGGSGIGVDGLVNGTIYGLLRDIVNLQETHSADGMALCFDEGTSKRKEIFAGYKCKRTSSTHANGTYGRLADDMRRKRREFHNEVSLLKRQILPALGFRNVFYEDGYEADDMIASVCRNSHFGSVIVAEDKDFYQLLTPTVSMWKPGKKEIYTEECFVKEWGLPPVKWKEVKAMSGCTTDDIPGVQGVKEITAAKYLRGELAETRQQYKNIKAQWPLIQRNMRLVALPFDGTPILRLKEDSVTRSKWRKVLTELGIKSLVDRCPVFC